MFQLKLAVELELVPKSFPSIYSSTFVTPTLSLALTFTFTVLPFSLEPSPGDVMVASGAVVSATIEFLTFTVNAELVTLLAAS